jgi:hypothetical protein
MSEHVTEHLSAYLDDELGAAERAAVDAHLRTCASCASELTGLRRLVHYAATVPDRDTVPPRDLWPGIRARIERSNVVEFTAPDRGTPRRFSFSAMQLAAAAALLVAVSAGTTWWLRGGMPLAAGTTTSDIIHAEIEPTPDADAARLVNFADAQYDAAVSDLERALAERRNDLNPRTVEILERNLKLIDAAIAQARQALEEDPGNTYLNRHLVESRLRKLDLLRRATAITEGD